MTSPQGRPVTSYYNTNNLLTNTIRIPGLHDTVFGYDTKGRRTSVKTQDRETAFTYDPQWNVETVTTKPDNRTFAYEYDSVGRVKEIHRPDESVVSFDYDFNGNMKVLSTPRPADHVFGFNKVNLPSSYTIPMSSPNVYSYAYDKDRRLTQINFPSGRQIVNIYENGRLSKTQTPEGLITYGYDCAHIGSITKGGEIISYGYDGSLLKTETSDGQTLTYGYDNDFAVRSFGYAGETIGLNYDNDGLLTSAGNFVIGRNSLNGLPETVSGGVFSLSRSFNGYGETDSETYTVNNQNVFRNQAFMRGNSGRIITKRETIGGTDIDYVYSYDPMGRLEKVTKDGTLVEEYHYDNAGTRVYEMNTLRGNTAGKILAYDDDDRLLTVGTTTY